MEQTKVYTCKDTLFYNSQCLFIEYHDVLKSPWLILLNVVKNNEDLNRVFDMSEIKNLDGQYDWIASWRNSEYYKKMGGFNNKDVMPSFTCIMRELNVSLITTISFSIESSVTFTSVKLFCVDKMGLFIIIPPL